MAYAILEPQFSIPLRKPLLWEAPRHPKVKRADGVGAWKELSLILLPSDMRRRDKTELTLLHWIYIT